MRNKILIGVSLLLIVGLLVGCSVIPTATPLMTGQVLASESNVIVKWYGQCRITGQQLADLGIDFVSITAGNIGAMENPEKGVAIEFASMPSATALAQIDNLMPSCDREGKLPWSLHVAALKSVTMVDGSPRATVYRLYDGVVYEVSNCRVCQTAYDNYMAGKIQLYNPAYNWRADENKDCFVTVYFISETPYGDEVMIPVVIDKVIK